MYVLSYGNSNSLVGAGTPSVQKMQTALAALAQVAGNPAMNPGGADGIVGSRTIGAVVASMGLLTKHLGQIGGVIQAGLAVTAIASPAQAASLITQYASQLEQAARAAAIAVSQGTQPATVPPVAPVPMPSFGIPWYKTWWGMGAIGVGALGTVAIIFSMMSPRRAAAAE